MMDVDALLRDLLPLPAREIVGRLARREVSPTELVEASARRIEAVDGALNALPTRCLDRARDHAGRIEKGDVAAGALGGLPVAVKDLNDLAGVRTTYGSIVFADHVPVHSDYTIERLEANGAIVMAKSNTPEFGAGGATFNDVFGITANPWNTALTSGGSSGGSAAAVASGQVWGAQGSDLGGSLRIPASFCGVVGLRPTPGVVARGPASQPFSSLWADGPIARDVPDCALLLDAMAGLNARDPLSRAAPAETYCDAAGREPGKGLRIAWSRDLGISAVDPAVETVFTAAVECIKDTGADAAETHPDLTSAADVFHTLRAAWLAGDMADLVAEHEDRLKPELVWNVRKGMELTSDAIGRAEVERGRIYRRMVDFFAEFDLLVTPATVVPPFDKELRFPDTVAGRKLETYLDWYVITYAVSVTACPALSLPIGFTTDGLPVGMQVIAPPFAEARLLAWAAALEAALGTAPRVPIDPRP